MWELAAISMGSTARLWGSKTMVSFPALTRALLERGYTAEQIGKLYGGNTLRLMRDVERVAKASK